LHKINLLLRSARAGENPPAEPFTRGESLATVGGGRHKTEVGGFPEKQTSMDGEKEKIRARKASLGRAQNRGRLHFANGRICEHGGGDACQQKATLTRECRQ